MPAKVLLGTLFLIVLSVQLFLPPIIGLADNGDFWRVTGGLCLVPVEFPNYTSEYNYFISRWRHDQTRCAHSSVPTSEKALAFTAWSVSRWFTAGDTFDIRWLGILHLLIYATGCWAFIRSLELVMARIPCILTGLFAVLALTDLSYTAYFHSFYADAAAVPAFIALSGLTLLLGLSKNPTTLHICAAGCAAALYVTSKTPHSFAGIPVAAFLILQSLRLTRSGRIAAIACAGALLAATVGMYRLTPEIYSVDPFFSIVFYEIVGRSAHPEHDLVALGLGPEHAAARGMYTYEDRWPANDVPWKLQAYQQARGFGGLARYYLAHPSRALSILIAAMRESCRDMRPLLLANFRRQDGFSPGSQSRIFGLWSAVKRPIYVEYAPWLLLLYVAALMVAVTLWTRGVPGGPWILMVWAIGCGELLISTLGDACETSRHLLLFHAATDVLTGAMLACAVVVLAAWPRGGRPSGMVKQSEHSKPRTPTTT